MDEHKRHVAFRETINKDIRQQDSDSADDVSHSEGGGVSNPTCTDSDVLTQPNGDGAPQRQRRKRRPTPRGDGPDFDIRFTRWKEAVVVVCLVFYISDLLLDAWVLRTFIVMNNIRQAWFMGFCMLIPNLYAGYKSLQWYLRAHQDHPVTDPVVWLIRVGFFPVSLIIRYYDTVRRGYSARAAEKDGNKRRQARIMENFVSESAEVAMLRLFVIFLEDAPICVLNLVHVFATNPDDIENVGYSVGVVVAKLSCSITLGVLHYAAITKLAWHACYQTNAYLISQNMKRSEETDVEIPSTRSSMRGLRSTKMLQKQPSLAINSEEFHSRATLSPLAHLLLYCWQISTIGSRLVCYALFVSVFHIWVLVLASVRWVLNTICILVDVRNMSLANCASFGGVYLFTFVSTSTHQQYLRLTIYYIANVIEAVAVSVVWWIYSFESPYHEMGFGLLVGGTAVSVLFMLLYYALGHPNRKDTWGCLLYRSRKVGDVEESTDM